jgi:hypothetical protein
MICENVCNFHLSILFCINPVSSETQVFRKYTNPEVQVYVIILEHSH